MGEKRFVQFITFKADRAWRQLDEKARCDGRAELVAALERGADITTHAYSTLGMKREADLLLWRMSETPEALQESLSRLLMTGLGKYLDVVHTFVGQTRSSNYVKRPTTQEQAIQEL